MSAATHSGSFPLIAGTSSPAVFEHARTALAVCAVALVFFCLVRGGVALHPLARSLTVDLAITLVSVRVFFEMRRLRTQMWSSPFGVHLWIVVPAVAALVARSEFAHRGVDVPVSLDIQIGIYVAGALAAVLAVAAGGGVRHSIWNVGDAAASWILASGGGVLFGLSYHAARLGDPNAIVGLAGREFAVAQLALAALVAAALVRLDVQRSFTLAGAGVAWLVTGSVAPQLAPIPVAGVATILLRTAVSDHRQAAYLAFGVHFFWGLAAIVIATKVVFSRLVLDLVRSGLQ